ncbi:hypothetical protein LEP1GSC188_0880 [Leptospira weilii serovar Topaz str. LT2116]|uniref:Uncharacterized protein n=1 Tax=Leptospira weilii serovar Topaz str. LT2116 TaxID=1088540 RepID=M3GYT4_9LEPT|nr:hypothetical protein LEP1GSC188_0880 [Leptospira weilii serovar Topaz str. LT2116]
MVLKKPLNLFQNFGIVGTLTRLTMKRRFKKLGTFQRDGYSGNYYSFALDG